MFLLQGSVTPFVMRRVVVFGAYSAAVTCASLLTTYQIHSQLAPYEVAGAVLGLLLVLRTNAGYDRWWEARVLWGGIVNQARNLAISAVAYGPERPEWRDRLTRWTAAFPHAARCSLRGERTIPEIRDLLGDEEAERVALSEHMPGYVASRLADLLNQAVRAGQLDGFAFMQIDRERARLIDHIGACERILSTPLTQAYSIKIRRFLMLFMVTLPFGLLETMGWMTPFVTMLVSYPLFSLDQIGVELENPFCVRRLGHLPLDRISNMIEGNVLALPDLDLPINGRRNCPGHRDTTETVPTFSSVENGLAD